jgi:hypothetical protein
MSVKIVAMLWKKLSSFQSTLLNVAVSLNVRLLFQTTLVFFPSSEGIGPFISLVSRYETVVIFNVQYKEREKRCRMYIIIVKQID